MADRITKEQRKKNMQAIRSQSKLENEISRRVWREGFRFRKNDRTLYGRPDISIKKYKVVIFIDSCFWHSCEIHGNFPKTNEEYWSKKLSRNKERDQEVNQYYLNNGWFIKRIWEHEFKENSDKVIKDIIALIIKAKATYDE
ncbi:DNA mismatch endonuclease (patch repair protein) [Planomicrobium sp. HSC-17F08]|nr:DNA mismatch endonuclease (patch repair protein) [Planomicrobium sp. HSC-17F08]